MSREIPASILARYPRFSELPQDVVDSAIANAEDPRTQFIAGRQEYSFEREQQLIEEFLRDALKDYDRKRIISLIPPHILERNPRFLEIDYPMVEMIEAESHDSRNSYGLVGRPDIPWDVMEKDLTRALKRLDEEKLKEQEGKQKP